MCVRKYDELRQKIKEGQANLRKLKAERRKLDKEIRLRIAEKAKERNKEWFAHAYKKLSRPSRPKATPDHTAENKRTKERKTKTTTKLIRVTN